MSRERIQRGSSGPRRLIRGLTAAAATAALFGSVTAATAQAAYPGQDGRIAFVRHGQIFTIRTNRTGLRRLTRGHDCSGPRWSPSGSQLAYLCGGNLWIMAADGSHRRRVTDLAPLYVDPRPSWSPNGRYLAFVVTKRGHTYGYLTRYSTVTHQQVVFSIPYRSELPTVRQVKVTALPAPVAWGTAVTGSTTGSFILFNGTRGNFCLVGYYCLVALGAPTQAQYRNEYPSAEELTPVPTRMLDPDWFPNSPPFNTGVLTTQESCTAGTCMHDGLILQIEGSIVHQGAYQGVYSPDGAEIAYVQDSGGVPTIYLAATSAVTSDAGVELTAGTEPDWQPLHVRTPATRASAR